MQTTSRQLLLAGVLIAGLLFSCKRWDDHIALTDQGLQEDLMEAIDSRPELSSFSALLKKTGLDSVLRASKQYTVWAPDNDALKALGTDTVGDTAKLKRLLLNHISPGLYITSGMKDSIRVPMLNGKKIFFHGQAIGSASLKEADIRVRNGALQVLSAYLPPLPSIWEFLEQTKSTYLQNAFVTSLNFVSQDPSLAVVDSIDGATGQPVYRPGTGLITLNTYLTEVADLSDEDSLYTYFVLIDNAYTAARDRQKPFFQSTDPAIADTNACWNVVKDLAFRGMVSPSDLPDSMVSVFGVHVPVAASAIVSSVRMSNGIVYILRQADCRMDEKIPVAYVQGETPIGFSKSGDDFMAKVFYRSRLNALTGVPFSDIYLNLGSGGANTYAYYATNNLYTTTYKVYWVALNDMVVSGQGDDPYGTDSTLQQILQIGTFQDSAFTPSFNVQAPVAPNDYHEVYLGEYTNTGYDWNITHPLVTPDGTNHTINAATRELRLAAPPSVGSGIPYNLTLDYIKLVPEF